MAQLVGEFCAVCHTKVCSVVDGLFCPICDRAVHNNCMGLHPGADQEHCPRCGGNLCTTTCAFCDTPVSPSALAYIEVSRAFTRRGYAVKQWWNIRCLSCDKCRGRVNRIRWRGPLILIAALLWLACGTVVGAVLNHPQGNALGTAIILAGWVLVPFIFIAGNSWIKRRSRKALGARALLLLQEHLKWTPGLGSFIKVSRDKPPDNQSVMDATPLCVGKIRIAASNQETKSA